MSLRLLGFRLENACVIIYREDGVGRSLSLGVVFVPGTGFPDTIVEPKGELDEVPFGGKEEESTGIGGPGVCYFEVMEEELARINNRFAGEEDVGEGILFVPTKVTRVNLIQLVSFLVPVTSVSRD